MKEQTRPQTGNRCLDDEGSVSFIHDREGLTHVTRIRRCMFLHRRIMNIKFKDCVKNAAVLLQNRDVLNLPEFSEKAADNLNENCGKADLDLLIDCGNLIYSELAGEYIPLIVSENFCNKTGIIEFSEFSKNVVDILSVSDLKDVKQYFCVYSNYLNAPRGEIVITYSYLPNRVNLSNELDYPYGKLSDRIIAYGICAEYSVVKGMLSEAAYFDKKFKDSLLNSCRPKSVYIPPRRWY